MIVGDLSNEDIRGLNYEIELGQRICAFYLDTEWDSRLETLDDVYGLWFNDRQKKPSPNEVSLGLGALTGEYLRSNFGCRWVLITESTCELGLVNDANRWQVFPRHWIAKRIGSCDPFISEIVRTLQQDGIVDP
jgi:hypothetical protein